MSNENKKKVVQQLQVKATFQGQEGSCGYKRDKEYILNIIVFKGFIIVGFVSGDNTAPEEVKYGSIFAFMANWNSVQTQSFAEFERDLTFGEWSAGVGFNPGGHGDVDVIKQRCADVIDQCNDLRGAASTQSAGRYFSKAISHIEDGQMNAVKAITWGGQ